MLRRAFLQELLAVAGAAFGARRSARAGELSSEGRLAAASGWDEAPADLSPRDDEKEAVGRRKRRHGRRARPGRPPRRDGDCRMTYDPTGRRVRVCAAD